MANIKSTIGKGVKRYGELLSGSGVKKLKAETLMKGNRATNAKKAVENALNVAKTKKPGARTSELESVIGLTRAGNKAHGDFHNAYGRYKNELIKSTGARIGTAGALGAGAYGVSKAMGNGEKQAFEIVEESFNKVADFAMGDMISDDVKAKLEAMKGGQKNTKTINKAGIKGNLRPKKTNFSGKMNYVKPNAPSLDDLGKMYNNASKGMSKKTKLALGLGGAATLGAAGYGASKLINKREKSACEIVEETFDKVAANVMMMTDMPDYDKALGDLGVKGYKKSVVDKVVDAVKPERAPKNEYLDGLAKNYKKNKKSLTPKKENLKAIKGLAKGKGAKIGAGIVAGTGALAGLGYGISKMRNNEEKAASEIVEESFDKIAALKFGKSKNIGKSIKNIATGKNIKNAINDLEVAGKAGAYKDTLKRLKGDRNREVAKTVGLHAAGLAGLGGTGYGASKAIKNKEK